MGALGVLRYLLISGPPLPNYAEIAFYQRVIAGRLGFGVSFFSLSVCVQMKYLVILLKKREVLMMGDLSAHCPFKYNCRSNSALSR